MPEHDPVNHPQHYTSHPSGIECIQITEHMNFNCGNAVKYIWRADLKNGIEDLEKARWYIEREISRRKRSTPPSPPTENERLRQSAAHPAITHCDNCGCDWLDNGLNPIGCPYCKQPDAEAGETGIEWTDPTRAMMDHLQNPRT